MADRVMMIVAEAQRQCDLTFEAHHHSLNRLVLHVLVVPEEHILNLLL